MMGEKGIMADDDEVERKHEKENVRDYGNGMVI